jgi:hypothetical protein
LSDMSNLIKTHEKQALFGMLLNSLMSLNMGNVKHWSLAIWGK